MVMLYLMNNVAFINVDTINNDKLIYMKAYMF